MDSNVQREPNAANGGFCGRTRREFLWQTGAGFMSAALASMLFVSLATAAAGMAAVMAVSLWAPQNQKAINVHLAAAVVDGTINTHAAYGTFSTQRFPYYVIDCLIFGMMLAPSNGSIAEAVINFKPMPDSPQTDPRVPLHHDCQGMLGALPEAQPPRRSKMLRGSWRLEIF